MLCDAASRPPDRAERALATTRGRAGTCSADDSCWSRSCHRNTSRERGAGPGQTIGQGRCADSARPLIPSSISQRSTPKASTSQGPTSAGAVIALREIIRVMSFDVPADAYTRFMGRFSEPLAVQFADLAQVRAGQRALDVGCGPGALTAELVRRLGNEAVSAIDPSAPFVQAVRSRLPGVDVWSGPAEHLPFADDTFDVTLAQLVVHFMADPVSGLSEMARVTRPGGVVAASVWDSAGVGGPLDTFWRAVRDLDRDALDESQLSGAREGDLAELFAAAGLKDLEHTSLTVTVAFPSFTDWWEPFTFGVGPAGAHVARLDQVQRDLLRSRCEQLLPPAPFEIAASAWCVLAHP